MDWKNYPDPANLSYLYDYYQYKYHNKKLDLIIATDDAALTFALKNRKELFSDACVIFCGVNQDGAESLTKGYHKVTGVIEVVDPHKTIQLAMHINPNLKNIYLLYDSTESGLSTGQIVTDKINLEFPELNVVSLSTLSYDDILHTVETLNKDSVILVSSYISIIDGKIMIMDSVNREISEHSSVPVYHLHDFGMRNGSIGGIMLSGMLQGSYAGDLALRILKGEDPDQISFIMPDSTMAAMDYHQMMRFGISKQMIPKDILIVNKPFSFYDTYKSLVLTVIGIIFLLVIFISILLIYIRFMKHLKKQLAESHEELTQLYEELSASDEEMRQQYDEMIEINEKFRLGEEKLAYLAYHDVLTGLPNKLSLYEDSRDVLIPDRGKAALLFIDIDNLKYVNDTMGHVIGDELIKEISDRISSYFNDCKCVYRISGDEFIVLVQNMESNDDIKKVASDILSSISNEFHIKGSILNISVSIGVAIYPEHGARLEQLLKYADIAMYRVKETGRKNYMVYNAIMNEEFMERVNIEKYLQKALENNEFELYYQPQVELENNKITGFEALLRWNNPQLGRVSPLKFIEIAEDTRYIIPLGAWVLESACQFLKSLHDMGYSDLMISVNISILQLIQSDFCFIVTDTLSRYGLEPKYLELEITESILMESIETIEMELIKLSDMEIKIALDDFGKGYSSLNYLRQLPISTLKVDKSFIDCIIDETEDSLTGHIVNIGKSMGMSVVAEGVEKLEQLEYLQQYRCDKIQGFLFSKPLPESEIIKLLQKSTDLSEAIKKAV